MDAHGKSLNVLDLQSQFEWILKDVEQQTGTVMAVIATIIMFSNTVMTCVYKIHASYIINGQNNIWSDL